MDLRRALGSGRAPGGRVRRARRAPGGDDRLPALQRARVRALLVGGAAAGGGGDADQLPPLGRRNRARDRRLAPGRLHLRRRARRGGARGARGLPPRARPPEPGWTAVVGVGDEVAPDSRFDALLDSDAAPPPLPDRDVYGET